MTHHRFRHAEYDPWLPPEYQDGGYEADQTEENDDAAQGEEDTGVQGEGECDE